MSYGYGLHREPSDGESTENTPIRYQLCVASRARNEICPCGQMKFALRMKSAFGRWNPLSADATETKYQWVNRSGGTVRDCVNSKFEIRNSKLFLDDVLTPKAKFVFCFWSGAFLIRNSKLGIKNYFMWGKIWVIMRLKIKALSLQYK